MEGTGQRGHFEGGVEVTSDPGYAVIEMLTLEMLTLAPGIKMSRDVAEGQLLTARRRAPTAASVASTGTSTGGRPASVPEPSTSEGEPAV